MIASNSVSAGASAEEAHCTLPDSLAVRRGGEGVRRNGKATARDGADWGSRKEGGKVGKWGLHFT